MPYITLSPNWCLLCNKENESQSHLFMQWTYAQNFWTMILNIFGWHLTFPREVKDFLDMALTYHPFKTAKALLWKNLIMAFFRNLWKERNQRIFVETNRPTQNFSTMLFTKLYLGVNSLIFLLPIVIPPSLQFGKVFCKHHGLYIPLVNFTHQWNCLL